MVVGLVLVVGASVALATVWDDSVPVEEFVATAPAIELPVASPTAQPTQPPQPTPTPLAEPTPAPEAEADSEQLANTAAQEPTSGVPGVVQDQLVVMDPIEIATPTPQPTAAPTPHSDPTPTPAPHTHPDPAPTPHEDPTPQADNEEAPHAHPDPTPQPTAVPEATPEPTEDPDPTPDPTPGAEEDDGSGGPTAAQWEALRQCESGGNYSIVSANGLYRGAYQFSQGTWDSTAGGAWPELVGADPAEASPADQDKMAFRLYDLRGAGPWPVCGQQLL